MYLTALCKAGFLKPGFIIKTIKVMKLTTVFIIAACLQVSAKGYSQKVTLKENDISLQKLFEEIRKQTGYHFFYADEVLVTSKKVSLNFKKASIGEVLDFSFKNQHLTYTISDNTIIVKRRTVDPEDNAPPPQTAIEIKGTVTNDKDQPIAGASIILKGTGEGTATDENGNFTLLVPDKGGVLVISYVGFETTEVPVSTSGNINVKLKQKESTVDEVVVVGYGTQKKATLTGSVAVVKGTDIAKSPAGNVSNNLVGRTPGVIATNNSGEPGNDGSRIFVRGISTFSGATSPLIVIDGVANRPGGFERIDPNDIESVSVLKDASAAIYGAQAANGVILITTKRGRTGKPTITFNYNQGFNTWAKTEKYLNAADYAQMKNEISEFSGGVPIYTQAEIDKFRNGSDPVAYPNTDWTELATKKVAMQNRASVTLSGGTDKVKYYTSVGMLNQDGQFKDGVWKFKQYNFSANVDAQVNNVLKLSFGTQLRWQKKEGSPIGTANTFSSLAGALPTDLAINPDGSYATGGLSNGGNLNPLVNSTDLAGITTNENLYSLNTARFRLDIPYVKGLFIDGFLSVDLGVGNNNNWSKSYQVYDYDPLNNTYTPQVQNGNLGLAYLDVLSTNSTTVTQNIKLNYERTFEKHTVNAFVSYEQSKFNFKYTGAHKEQFISQAIPQLDYGSSTNQTNNGNGNQSARQNYFGRVNYSYDNKYLIEAQLRYDGSYQFSKDNRYGLFPSFSAGWRLSEEEWFNKSLPGVSNLKLRASWGKLGNDNIAPFQYAQFYFLNRNGRLLYNNGGIVNYPAFSAGVVGNPDATWESQTSTNIALEAGFFANKLNFTLEAFKQRRDDILAPPNASVPLYAGITLPDKNIGIVENKGIEAQAGYKSNRERINYYVSGNFTYAKNKIIFADEKLASKPAYQAFTGNPVGAGLIYNAVGVFQTQREIDDYAEFKLGSPPIPGDLKFEDVNKDGFIDQKDQVIQPFTSVPQITYGVSMGLTWNQLSFDFLFQGQGRASRYYRAVSGRNQNFTQEDFDGRSTPGHITDRPRSS